MTIINASSIFSELVPKSIFEISPTASTNFLTAAAIARNVIATPTIFTILVCATDTKPFTAFPNTFDAFLNVLEVKFIVATTDTSKPTIRPNTMATPISTLSHSLILANCSTE